MRERYPSTSRWLTRLRYVSHALLKSQRNAVLAAIMETALRPSEFEWREVHTEYFTDWLFNVPALFHGPSDAHFIFDRSGESNVARYSPGESTQSATVIAGSWDAELGQFRAWLTYVQREHEAPDLWAELDAKTRLHTPARTTENTPFEPFEIEQVLRAVAETREYAGATLALTEAQKAHLDTTLDYLAEAATRMGRVDWKSVLVGSMVEAMISAAIPQEAAQSVMNMLLRSVAHLFGVELPELPLA